MINATTERLQSDSELMSILLGGIYGGVIEISRQNTPDAFDANKELQPCLLVKTGTVTPTGPYTHSHSQTIEMYLYQENGYDVITAAARRIYALLHDQRIEPITGYGSWPMRQIYKNLGLEDQALKCALGLLRFQVLITEME